MPAQRTLSVSRVDPHSRTPSPDLGRRGTLEEIQPYSPPASPSSPVPEKSSWSLLKKLFKENKAGNNKPKEVDDIETSGKKSRRFSIDHMRDPIVCESPKLLRRRDSCVESPKLTRKRDSNKSTINRQRKTSLGATTSKSMRKFSTANTQENLLHFAVLEKDIITLTKILDANKVDINFMRPPGLSALHQACVTGDVRVIKLLTQHGADLNLKTWSGLSPLQIATLFGHFEAAQLLIQEGANSIDVQNGFTHDLKLMSTVLVR